MATIPIREIPFSNLHIWLWRNSNSE
ncbi:hypothetical protein CP02DC14_0039A, partial [Chlamydia psittaci 02DC14]